MRRRTDAAARLLESKLQSEDPMGILLAFAPFVAFAIIDRLVGPIEGLLAGAAVSAALIARDRVGHKRSPKVLEIGTFLLFGGMAAYALLAEPGWSIMEVRLRVDAGLLLVVLVSMAIGKPFTLQYAREGVSRDLWENPGFVRTNYVITGAWAVAFLVMVLADLLLIYRPDVPPRYGIIATVLAIWGAVKFTGWYPERGRG